MVDYKLLKSIIKGAFTFIPGVCFLLEKKKKESMHSGSNAEFVYSLWLSVLVYMKENKIKPNLSKIGEVGNGGSLGIAFCAILTGTKKYYDLEYKGNINILRQIELLDQILILFKEKTPIKSFDQINIKVIDQDFPSDLILPYKKQIEIAEKLKKDLHNKLNDSNLIHLVNRWESASSLYLNFVFSRAVMEHILNPLDVYKAINKHLLPDSYMFHDIEFHSHGITHQINDHLKISDFWWSIIFGKRPFYLNRWEMKQHLSTIEKTGFLITKSYEIFRYNQHSKEQKSYGAVVVAKKYRETQIQGSK
jgi:hypothetical protein